VVNTIGSGKILMTTSPDARVAFGPNPGSVLTFDTKGSSQGESVNVEVSVVEITTRSKLPMLVLQTSQPDPRLTSEAIAENYFVSGMSQSFWKRGSPRSGSNIGSSRSNAGVNPALAAKASS
jgi:hypothetical protein